MGTAAERLAKAMREEPEGTEQLPWAGLRGEAGNVSASAVGLVFLGVFPALAGSSLMANVHPHGCATSAQRRAWLLALVAVAALHLLLQEREWKNLGLETEPEIGKASI